MNLPNKLTIARIGLTFVFMAFLFVGGVGWKIAALVVFLLASLTDALDGYLAKKSGQITDFGRLMDPIADKVLVLAALLAFVQMGIVQAWMAVVIILREIVVTGLRVLALSKGEVIAADAGGKQKTILQLLTIVVILLFVIFRSGGHAIFGFWTPGLEAAYRDAIFFIMLVTVALTLTSGISYLVKNKEVYSNAKTD